MKRIRLLKLVYISKTKTTGKNVKEKKEAARNNNCQATILQHK